jgi:AcrR family transcriptional regulator
MIELVAEHGFERLTVRRLAGAAGVSTRTFYGHFANADECLASTVDAIGERLLRHAADRGWGRRDRDENVRQLVLSLTQDLAARPKATRLLLVEVFSGSSLARERADLFTSDLEQLLAGRLGDGQSGAVPSRLTLAVAAGIVRVARTTSLAGRVDELPALAGSLADWALSLDCGEVRELEALACARPGKDSRREPQPFLDEPDGSEPNDARHGERERILAAAASIAAAEGFGALSVTRIRQEAGVSRRAFDARFADAAECFLAAVASIVDAGTARAGVCAARARGREQRLRRGLLALCAQAARDERRARLALVEVLVPGRDGLLLREQLVGEVAGHLRSSSSEQMPAQIAAEASAAAVWRIAESALATGRARQLPALAALLSYIALADSPY